MDVLIAFVNFQLLAHGPAQLVLGQHSQDCFLDHEFRLAMKTLAEIFFAQPAGESGAVAGNVFLFPYDRVAVSVVVGAELPTTPAAATRHLLAALLRTQRQTP